MDIVVLDLEKVILFDLNLSIKYIKETSKFFQEFKNNIIAIFNKSTFLGDLDIYVLFDTSFEVKHEITKLNEIAKSRMIYNFEKEYPEISLIIMSSGQQSMFVKFSKK